MMRVCILLSAAIVSASCGQSPASSGLDDHEYVNEVGKLRVSVRVKVDTSRRTVSLSSRYYESDSLVASDVEELGTSGSEWSCKVFDPTEWSCTNNSAFRDTQTKDWAMADGTLQRFSVKTTSPMIFRRQNRKSR